MLDKYFIKPQTIDHIRANWLAEPIERYVTWLHERGYAARTVFHRVASVSMCSRKNTEAGHFSRAPRLEVGVRWE